MSETPGGIKDNNPAPHGVSVERLVSDASDAILGNMVTGLELAEMFKAGWVIVPCSCACGGNWAWMKPRESGAKEMFGCVCHKTGRATTHFRFSR